MEDILKRETKNVSFEHDECQMYNLDGLPVCELKRMLTTEERKEFEKLILEDRINQYVEIWKPWWEIPQSLSAKNLKTPFIMELKSGKDGFPVELKLLPLFNINLLFNALDSLLSFIRISLLLNGEHVATSKDDCEFVKSLISHYSDILIEKSPFVFESAEHLMEWHRLKVLMEKNVSPYAFKNRNRNNNLLLVEDSENGAIIKIFSSLCKIISTYDFIFRSLADLHAIAGNIKEFFFQKKIEFFFHYFFTLSSLDVDYLKDSKRQFEDLIQKYSENNVITSQLYI